MMNKGLKNRLQLLNSFFKKDEKANGYPLEVGIELTNRCNLRCVMCPHAYMVDKKIRPLGDMDFKLFKKIIDEVAPFAEIVYLHGMGESLLHPKVFEFMKYAKSRNVPLGLSTNATLLNKERAKSLLDTKIDYVILAMDGVRKKTYESIRVGANFKKVEENIKFLLKSKRKRKNPPFCVIQFITMPQNESEAAEFSKKWKALGADAVRVKPKIALKESEKSPDSNPCNYCFHIFRQINVTWDGEVMACCEDVFADYSLGNVKKESLLDLWNGKKMKYLRDINFKGQREKVKICRNCAYPQPTKIQAAGVMMFDHMYLKKILPRLERLFKP